MQMEISSSPSWKEFKPGIYFHVELELLKQFAVRILRYSHIKCSIE